MAPPPPPPPRVGVQVAWEADERVGRLEASACSRRISQSASRANHNQLVGRATSRPPEHFTGSPLGARPQAEPPGALSVRVLLALALLLGQVGALAALASAADDFGSLAARFAFESTAAGAEFTTAASPPLISTTPNRASAPGSPFIWQPLPLRATFRPLNRQQSGPASGLPATEPPAPPAPPTAPRAPRPPRPPAPPEPLALTISERSIASDAPPENGVSSAPAAPSRGTRFSSARDNSLRDNPFASAGFFQPPSPAPFAAPATPTPAPSLADEDDELPTRQPLARFRPTRAPSDDADANSTPATGSSAPSAAFLPAGSLDSNSADLSSGNTSSSSSSSGVGMSRECFECICEASTNCNSQSRCQTSDVRHTRCGLFLISYDQWLSTGLSRELVSREALARDAAADERAFYECVTTRDCAQRLLTIYMERHRKDCDKDGRVDCYDLAAVHHSGMDQCASESLLDSQYWTDFNACLGFGR